MWDTKQLGKVVERITVGHVGPMADRYVERGIPFLRSLNVKPYRISTTDLKFISPQFNEELSKSSLSPGDVVVVRTGNTGTAAVIPKWLTEANCSDLVIIRTGNDVDSHFLAYYLNSAVGKHQINSRNVGSVQAHFNIGAARKLPINLPSIREQKAISAVLSAFDDKIELNRQMNATLEEMARAIFKSWFVDFDPVHAKAHGEQPYGMDAETAALFPDRFEVVDVREVPAGWRVSVVEEEINTFGGGTPSTKNPDYWEDGKISFATPKDLSGLQSPVLRETARCITEAGLCKISSGLLQVGTVLMSSRAPVGYLAINIVPVAINQGFIAMQSGDSLSQYYILWWAKENMHRIEQRASGTTFREISKKNFRPMKILVPPKAIVERFDAIVGPLFEMIVSNENEIQTLSELRDTLLPRLMSDQLRVPIDGI